MSGGRFRLQVTDLTASTVISNTDIEDGMTTQRQFDANQLGETGGGTGGVGGSAVGASGAGAAIGGPAGAIAALPAQWKDNLNWNTDVKKGTSGAGGSGQRSPRQDPVDEGIDYFSNDSGAADAALTKAQARTREKNKRQYESDITLAIGNPLIAAGQTFLLVGCGQFDGIWFIETAHHVVGPTYDTSLHIRRTLNGY
jgi:hypothetical protein